MSILIQILSSSWITKVGLKSSNAVNKCNHLFSVTRWQYWATLINRARIMLRPLLSLTGGWWHLNWAECVRSNDWSGISGMVSNTLNTWFPGVWCHSMCAVPAIIMSCSPLIPHDLSCCFMNNLLKHIQNTYISKLSHTHNIHKPECTSHPIPCHLQSKSLFI